MNRKERRAMLPATCLHAKFLHSEKNTLPVELVQNEDWRVTARLKLEGYASTRVKDGSGDVVEPGGIDLSRFEAGNAPLKVMHGRGVLSNIWVILSAKVDAEDFGLWITAEARLDVSKDNNWRPINNDDYLLYDRLINGTINWFSIGFHDIKEKYDDEKKVNVIYGLKLHEISLVDIPDNPLTIRKMLDIYHSQKDVEADVLEDDLTPMPKPTNVTVVKSVDPILKISDEGGEVTAPEESVEETEGGEPTADTVAETEQKDLVWEASIDDMLRTAIMNKLGISAWIGEHIFVVDVFKAECVYNHYKYTESGPSFDKYFRIAYTISWSEAILNGEPTEVKPTTYWVDKKNLLATLNKEISQESDSSWNAEVDPQSETSVEVNDEGTTIPTPEMEVKETVEEEVNETEEVEKVLQKALEAIDLCDRQSQLIAAQNEELAKYRSIKVSNGLKLTEKEATKKTAIDVITESISKSL